MRKYLHFKNYTRVLIPKNYWCRSSSMFHTLPAHPSLRVGDQYQAPAYAHFCKERSLTLSSLNLKILTGDGRNTTESGGKAAQLWNVPMLLNNFLSFECPPNYLKSIIPFMLRGITSTAGRQKIERGFILIP